MSDTLASTYKEGFHARDDEVADLTAQRRAAVARAEKAERIRAETYDLYAERGRDNNTLRARVAALEEALKYARGFVDGTVRSLFHGPAKEEVQRGLDQIDAALSVPPAPAGVNESLTTGKNLYFEFREGPWECSDLPTIIRHAADGGDHHILATLKRIHDRGALHDLCGLANQSIDTAPTTPRRDPVKAGALILAEIERLDRLTSGEGE